MAGAYDPQNFTTLFDTMADKYKQGLGVKDLSVYVFRRSALNAVKVLVRQPRRICEIYASLSHMHKYRRIHGQQHFPRFPLTPLSSLAGPSSPMAKLGVGRPSQLLRLSPCPNLKLP